MTQTGSMGLISAASIAAPQAVCGNDGDSCCLAQARFMPGCGSAHMRPAWDWPRLTRRECWRFRYAARPGAFLLHRLDRIQIRNSHHRIVAPARIGDRGVDLAE